MYFLYVCVKDDPKLVRKIVKELSSDAARHRFLCRNIGIRKIGFRGESSTPQFCDEIKHCLIDVGVEDSHEQDTINDRKLGDQRISKREKEKIIEEKVLKKAQKKLINAIYCY